MGQIQLTCFCKVSVIRTQPHEFGGVLEVTLFSVLHCQEACDSWTTRQSQRLCHKLAAIVEMT